MNRVTLLELLDQLEEMIDSAPVIPLTGRALIDGDQALELLARVRENLPEGLRSREEADQGPDPRPQEAEAARIVREAESYAARLVEEHEVMRRASEAAERLLEEARQRARDLEKDAEQYARDVLERLESSLERTLQVVQRGREELNGYLNNE